MAANYTHTTRADGLTLTAAIYNADHQNHIDNGVPLQLDDYSLNVGQMQSNVDPGEVGSESLPTSLAGELERIRFAIKEMKGTAQWYVSPSGVAVLNPLTSGLPFVVRASDVGDPTIEFVSLDAGAAAGPSLSGFRDSSSPAANDVGPTIQLYMRSSTGVKRLMGFISLTGEDPTNAAEQSFINVGTIVAGALATKWRFRSGFYDLGAAGADQGIGAINFRKYFADGLQFAPFAALTEDTSPDVMNDLLLEWDNSAGAYKKLKLRNVAPSLLDKTGVTVSIVNSAAETSIYTKVIPGGSIGLNGKLRVTINCVYLNDSGAGRTLTLRIKYAGTTIYDDVSIAIPALAVIPRQIIIHFDISNRNNLSSNALLGSIDISNVAGTTAGVGDIATAPLLTGIFGNNALGLDTSIDQTLDVTIQSSAATASQTFSMLHATAELI